jgi:hypothetical protein
MLVRLIVCLGALALLGSCSRTDVPVETPEIETETPAGMPGWLELHDLSLHRDTEAVAPQGLYIQGRIGEKGFFEPTSGIEGSAVGPVPGTGTTPGWVELHTRRFHRAVEAVAPARPYVEGVMDENGRFYPNEPYTIVTN